ncbi:hypothetical protein JHD50_13290 [Sulfurimonas sp. MAG313]|nr:hypothetical protein [Sulfurimonas sp. MAG313]MDF1882263.1 hypothetical protein [Sulfurimonas sp. MAG313]
MDEMYQMSQSFHIYSVIALVFVLVIMILVHKFSTDFRAFTKYIKILMIFHISLASAAVLTGSIMMAVKHLSLSPSNLLMIIAIFIIATLEIKRNKALSQVIRFGLMSKMTYVKLGFRYQLIELILLISVGAFSGMSNAISF